MSNAVGQPAELGGALAAPFRIFLSSLGNVGGERRIVEEVIDPGRGCKGRVLRRGVTDGRLNHTGISPP